MMESLVDVYDYPMPGRLTNKYLFVLVWASLFHVEPGEPFWSNDLRNIILNVFGEDVRSCNVGQALSEFCMAGYVKRYKSSGGILYVYMITDLFRKYKEAEA